jgi:hypothetical protein
MDIVCRGTEGAFRVDERFERAMCEREVVKDTRLLGDFAVIYCTGVHGGREHHPLISDGVGLGVYGRKVPVVCGECAALLAYAEKRRAYCPKDPKPFCSHCDTHCYKPDMREYMREVMRYAGPRSVLRGHAIDSFKHLAEARKHRKAVAKAATESSREERL